MSVNRHRHVAQCIKCNLRPQRWNLLCDVCFDEEFTDARRTWARTPTRSVGEHTRRPDPPAAQEAAR
jgi:hypothetical protein